MAFISYPVAELAEDLKIDDGVIAYAELQLGMKRNQRYMQNKERVRLGLQTSPENFFYDETAFAGATYINLNALEFTMLTGTAEAGVYSAAGTPGTEMFNVASVGGAGKAALKINPLLVEQVEVREGDTYSICVAGVDTPHTVQQIHISLKSSNKPDFTFYEWHPQSKYRFNRDCNVITDETDDTLSVAYAGVNAYVLSKAQFALTLAAALSF